jgi:predicted  nucleic acid-binding Zn-ribbon protein
MKNQTLFLVSDATDNADLIFEAAKRLKAAKGRLGNKADKETEARDEVRRLQEEAHRATGAMVNDEDTRDHRDLADIQRELKAAHNKLDRAIEKAHEDKTAINDALNELVMFLGGDNIDPTQTHDDEKEDAA